MPYIFETQTHQIRVQVEPEYLPAQSSAENAQYVWGYHITITNQGEKTVQLIARHWIIIDGNGVQQEVKGEGVVGEQPVIKTGETYRYSSGVPLSTPQGVMHGLFHMHRADDGMIDVHIPLFSLDCPDANIVLN